MSHPQLNIAVIGAGFAGAVFSQRMLEKDCCVTLFEKSRGTGGRLSSCRIGEQSADLGAPFIHAESEEFKQWLCNRAEIQAWRPNCIDFDGYSVHQQSGFVASPRQSTLTRSLVAKAELVTETRVGFLWPELEHNKNQVVIRDEKGQRLGSYDLAIVTAPARQAETLLEPVPSLVHKLQQVRATPSWVLVIELRSPSGLDAQLIQGQHPILKRCTLDSSKPRRTFNNEIWQLEANPQWSEKHKDANAEDIAEQLIAAFAKLSPNKLQIQNQRCHRWLYANHEGLDLGFLWNAEAGIGACGDWLKSGDIEAAWFSANALADQIEQAFNL